VPRNWLKAFEQERQKQNIWAYTLKEAHIKAMENKAMASFVSFYSIFKRRTH
jgi:hypothetical protein